MTTPVEEPRPAREGGLLWFVTRVARALVAQHGAVHLPPGHPWREWAAPDAADLLPWPVAEQSPTCVLTVSAYALQAVEALAQVAEADGLRVTRYADAAGQPACSIAAERFDGDEMALDAIEALGWRAVDRLVGGRLDPSATTLDPLAGWPFPVPVANVNAEPVDGVGCVLHVRVENAWTGHDALRRRFPAVLARFVAVSAAHDVSVAVGSWGSHRPVPVIELGRRRKRRPDV